MSQTFHDCRLPADFRAPSENRDRRAVSEDGLSNELACWEKGGELRFEALPRAIQGALCRVIERRSYRPGEAIFRRGESPEGLYRIETGVIKVTRQMPDGPEGLILDLRDRGESLGEETLFDDGPHLTSAWALKPVELSFVPRNELWTLMRECPEFLEQLLEIYAKRLQRAQDQLSMFYFADVECRLAALVLSLSRRFGRCRGDVIRLTVRLYRWDWAQLVGAREETVSRIFARWGERGWIRGEPGSLIVLDSGQIASCLELRHGPPA